jgi:calcium/calmodulin-dependent protein kinase (CaM kinase) II
MAETDLLLNLTKSLLDAIAGGNWSVYEELCDPSLTCYEPEAVGNLVEGMDFHRFYFEQSSSESVRKNTTMSFPHVRIMGDVAVVSYLRLTQTQVAGEPPTTARAEETRVWQRQDGQWKHVHFHRSTPAS